MALDADRGRDAVADVDDSRAFTGPDEDPRRFRRQAPKMQTGRFVRAVLRPHRREDPELDEIWLASQMAEDPAVFLLGEAVLPDDLGCDSRVHEGSAM